MSVRKSPQQKAREILANCVEKPDGCLLWQGPVNDKGYGYTTMNNRHQLVHRIVALYGVERTAGQIEELDKLYIKWTCGRTICMRLDGAHMRFSTSKPEKVWEDAGVLDDIIRSAGLAWR